MKSEYFIYIALGIIIFLAFLFRFYNLSSIPPGIHGDEAELTIISQKIINGKYYSFFSYGNTGQFFEISVLGSYVQGFFLRFIGDAITGMRFSSAFAGTLTVLVFFYLSRLYFKNKYVSLFTTLSLATSHFHIAYSRLALPNIWTPFFMVLIVHFLIKGIQKNKNIYSIYSGIVLGISLYFQQTTRVIPFMLLTIFVTKLLSNMKTWKKTILQAIILFSFASIIFFPQATFYLTHPNIFSPRLNEVSIFNHLPEYFQKYHTTNVVTVILWQFINTLKVFNFGGDIGFFFYGYQGSMVTPIIGFLFVLGLFLAFKKIKDYKNLILLVWFFIIVIMGGTATIDAPSTQRLVGIIPALFLITGLGVEFVYNKLRKKYVILLLSVLLIVSSIWDYKIYFIDYIHSQAGWAQREPATQLAYYFKSLGQNWKIFVVRENTWLYFKHGTVRLLNPNLEGEDYDQLENALSNNVATYKNIVFILPPNSPSLNKLKLLYPQGKTIFFQNPIGNNPSFISYEIYAK